MPCRDDYVETYEDGARNAEAKVRRELEPLLCEAFDLLEQNELVNATSDELRQWAQSHEVKETERTRNEALAKLTPKERRALGFK